MRPCDFWAGLLSCGCDAAGFDADNKVGRPFCFFSADTDSEEPLLVPDDSRLACADTFCDGMMSAGLSMSAAWSLSSVRWYQLRYSVWVWRFMEDHISSTLMEEVVLHEELFNTRGDVQWIPNGGKIIDHLRPWGSRLHDRPRSAIAAFTMDRDRTLSPPLRPYTSFIMTREYTRGQAGLLFSHTVNMDVTSGCRLLRCNHVHLLCQQRSTKRRTATSRMVALNL